MVFLTVLSTGMVSKQNWIMWNKAKQAITSLYNYGLKL